MLVRWFLNTDEATSASSYAAKVQRDIYDWSFLKSCSEVLRYLKNVDSAVSKKGYNLDTLAGYYGVQIENKKKADEVAKDLVTQLVQQSRCNNVRLRVEQHPIFVFNGTKVDNIMGCYDSQHNKSDVGVMEDKKHIMDQILLTWK